MPLVTQIGFYTPVKHLSTVCPGLLYPHIRRQQSGHKHVFGSLVVPVQIQVQGVAQEPHLQTDIRLPACFPLQVSVGETSLTHTGHNLLLFTATESVVRTTDNQRGIGERGYTVVTVHTPTAAKLQCTPLLGCIGPKVFVRNVPTQRERREQAPAVVRAEFVRTVTTQRGLEDISLLIIIVHAREVRCSRRVTASAGCGLFLARALRIINGCLVRIIARQVVCCAADVGISGLCGTLSDQYTELMVTAKSVVVTQRVLDLPRECTALTGRYAAGVAAAGTTRTQIIRIAVTVIAVETEVGIETRFPYQIGI